MHALLQCSDRSVRTHRPPHFADSRALLRPRDSARPVPFSPRRRDFCWGRLSCRFTTVILLTLVLAGGVAGADPAWDAVFTALNNLQPGQDLQQFLPIEVAFAAARTDAAGAPNSSHVSWPCSKVHRPTWPRTMPVGSWRDSVPTRVSRHWPRCCQASGRPTWRVRHWRAWGVRPVAKFSAMRWGSRTVDHGSASRPRWGCCAMARRWRHSRDCWVAPTSKRAKRPWWHWGASARSPRPDSCRSLPAEPRKHFAIDLGCAIGRGGFAGSIG